MQLYYFWRTIAFYGILDTTNTIKHTTFQKWGTWQSLHGKCVVLERRPGHGTWGRRGAHAYLPQPKTSSRSCPPGECSIQATYCAPTALLALRTVRNSTRRRRKAPAHSQLDSTGNSNWRQKSSLWLFLSWRETLLSWDFRIFCYDTQSIATTLFGGIIGLLSSDWSA